MRHPVEGDIKFSVGGKVEELFMSKKSCVELSVQLAVLLVIWRIKNMQAIAMKSYVNLKCE